MHTYLKIYNNSFKKNKKIIYNEILAWKSDMFTVLWMSELNLSFPFCPQDSCINFSFLWRFHPYTSKLQKSVYFFLSKKFLKIYFSVQNRTQRRRDNGRNSASQCVKLFQFTVLTKFWCELEKLVGLALGITKLFQ